jgi:hypothetical protein
MSRPEDIPALKSIKKKRIVFTGTLEAGTRDQVWVLARRAGALPVKDVAGTTEVVVQGWPNPSYKWKKFGVKLKRVEDLRGAGRLIYVVTEAEFDRLRRGRPLTKSQSVAAAMGGTAVFGVPWRPKTHAKGEPKGIATLQIDLDAIERRSRLHDELVSEVERAIREEGQQPLWHLHRSCAYDIGWQAGQVANVVEVKTTTSRNETQQMRLGLGQVLEYREELLRAGASRVRPHLVVSREPNNDSLLAACERAGVTVAWPGDFDLLFD